MAVHFGVYFFARLNFSEKERKKKIIQEFFFFFEKKLKNTFSVASTTSDLDKGNQLRFEI